MRDRKGRNIPMCLHCGMKGQDDSPDPCLGMLPHTAFACCGHGGKHGSSKPYICFNVGIEELPQEVKASIPPKIKNTMFTGKHGRQAVYFKKTDEFLDWVNTYLR